MLSDESLAFIQATIEAGKQLTDDQYKKFDDENYTLRMVHPATREMLREARDEVLLDYAYCKHWWPITFGDLSFQLANWEPKVYGNYVVNVGLMPLNPDDNPLNALLLKHLCENEPGLDEDNEAHCEWKFETPLKAADFVVRLIQAYDELAGAS
ncbi:MAG: hypothetical protein CMP20_04615 [Rickettsiales bacterium]|nr:hypothetical protein [Rickettsiales bacterium]